MFDMENVIIVRDENYNIHNFCLDKPTLLRLCATRIFHIMRALGLQSYVSIIIINTRCRKPQERT